MIKINNGRKIGTDKFESHEHVCDLIYLDGPLLSLYTDSKHNWLYLWCDTDKIQTNRWILIEISRSKLVDFFKKDISLRSIISDAPKIIIYDETVNQIIKEAEDNSNMQEKSISIKRKFIGLDDPSTVKMYWPSERSFFNSALAPDIDTEQEFVPDKHYIPVNGRWFFKDLDNFSRIYSRIYAFLYATKPQFINSMNERLNRLLRSPWTGGYSRVNLFNNLRRGLPALHDLQIERFNYASPGAIEVEALSSICEDVANIVLSSKHYWPFIETNNKIIGTIIGKHKLRKQNYAFSTNEDLPFTEEDTVSITNSCLKIFELMGISERASEIHSAAPNNLVYAKAVQALVGQVEKLVAFQDQGLLNLEKSQLAAEEDIKASAQKNI